MPSNIDWKKIEAERPECKPRPATDEQISDFKKKAAESLAKFLREQEEYRELSEQQVKDIRFV